MKYKSLWFEDKSIKKYSSLKRDAKVDVLIIGGGLTGLSTAYYLKKSGLKVMLVERDRIGYGSSGRNTGKITYLQGTIYSNLCRIYNCDIAKKYLYSQDLAISLIRKIIIDEKIDCNFKKCKSYVYADSYDEVSSLKGEINFLKNVGVRVKDYVKKNDNIKSKYMIGVDNTYTFNPVKYLDNLALICKKDKVKIYEQTKIINICKEKEYMCETSDGYKIKCKKLVIACQYPFFLKPYLMPLKVKIEKSYIIASLVDRYRAKSYINTLEDKSFRFYKDKNKYFIYLSNPSIICNNLNEKKNYNRIVRECDKLEINIDYYWNNIDLMSIDRLPYIGRLERNNDNLLIGTGYNTWGITNGTLAGYLLSKIIFREDDEYLELFSPLRVNKFNYIDKMLINSFYNIKGYLENKMFKNKYWYSNVTYEVIGNDEVAIYNDGNKEYIVYSKCPHLGCTLIFNEIDKTWDCPCHASRFNLEGKCIKGPSNYDITYNQDKEND